jgi:hypothetical protein
VHPKHAYERGGDNRQRTHERDRALRIAALTGESALELCRPVRRKL